jgi:hypothetical protein
VAKQCLSVAVASFLICACALSGCSQDARTSSPRQESFATPDEAVNALVAAVERQDSQALRNLLGPGTEKLISSGDAVADRHEGDSFLQRYREHHELVAGGPDNLVLLVGEDRWPVPIPLVRANGRWSLDGDAGAEELVLRRVGRNELSTIDVLQGFVAAQMDYAANGHDGVPSGVYAQKLRSAPGKHDGLYWEVAAGEPQSPAGPLLADATSEGYSGTQARHVPYHGYFFRMLTSQGPAANGGAREYVADGQLTGGFAVLAYPATYGASGIMTFVVNQDGVVWQRDLGKDTAEAVAAIRQFNPDDSWTPIAPP